MAGFDPDPAAIAQARRSAGIAGVADRVTFEVTATLLGHGYDLIIAPVTAAASADRCGNRSLRVGKPR